jgi:transitional endoplasmic reticulum ATPase
MENSVTRNSVHDSITTQILSEIDGMKYLNNIVIIDTTNTIDAIDSDLYHPGRLDLFIEVWLIFDIYAKTLLKNSLSADNLNIERLIHQTSGMTGAHIEKLVQRAVDF